LSGSAGCCRRSTPSSRSKERLIELLQEKRQALITQAVTKGLDPTVPMKESGIAWIGAIPRHWDCSPLGSRYSVQLGKMLDSGRAVLDAMNVPYLRNANVYWYGIDTGDLQTMPLRAGERERYRLRDGDLLVTEGGGNLNAVGKSAVWRAPIPECYYQKALHRLRPWRAARDLPEYLLYALRSAWLAGAFIAGANPNTVFHLTADQLRRHRFPFPPSSEQRELVANLDREVQRLEGATNMTAQSVSILREYRQTLISAAVTGQLDLATESNEDDLATRSEAHAT
jgi:type I restriction enzyme S subunit